MEDWLTGDTGEELELPYTGDAPAEDWVTGETVGMLDGYPVHPDGVYEPYGTGRTLPVLEEPETAPMVEPELAVTTDPE